MRCGDNSWYLGPRSGFHRVQPSSHGSADTTKKGLSVQKSRPWRNEEGTQSFSAWISRESRIRKYRISLGHLQKEYSFSNAQVYPFKNAPRKQSAETLGIQDRSSKRYTPVQRNKSQPSKSRKYWKYNENIIEIGHPDQEHQPKQKRLFNFIVTSERQQRYRPSQRKRKTPPWPKVQGWHIKSTVWVNVDKGRHQWHH